MFIVLKKKWFIFAVVLTLIFSLSLGTYFAVSASQKTSTVIVLDAGHGGVDLGVIGKTTGYPESNFNLEMSRLLEKNLKVVGVDVIQTRKTEDGLYKNFEKGFKLEDMKARKNIILDAQPTLVVSLHCNKYPDTRRRGIQVFYQRNSEEGKILAELIQTNANVLNMREVGREFSALSGDYYILNCSSYPSVIVECGFLSNPEDEALMLDPDYRDELAFIIFCGINTYLQTKPIS